jgi:hypothetical protein
VRQVWDTHQPKDEGETRRQEEQQTAEGNAVGRQHQPKSHSAIFLALDELK